jgi:hypothetical protein
MPGCAAIGYLSSSTQARTRTRNIWMPVGAAIPSPTHSPAGGTAAPGRAHQRPDRPPARRSGRNRPHPPRKRRQKAERLQPHCRGHPRVSQASPPHNGRSGSTSRAAGQSGTARCAFASGWAVAAGRSCGAASPACAVLAGTVICSSLQRVGCRWVPAVVAAPARDWSEAVFCPRLRREGGEEVD